MPVNNLPKYGIFLFVKRNPLKKNEKRLILSETYRNAQLLYSILKEEKTLNILWHVVKLISKQWYSVFIQLHFSILEIKEVH